MHSRIRAIAAVASIFLVPTLAHAQGLVGHWGLDGNIADQSPNGNDGDFLGALDPLYVEGADGEEEGAILFDGATDMISVQQNVGLPLYASPQFSIAMWVKGLPQPDFRVWSEGSTHEQYTALQHWNGERRQHGAGRHLHPRRRGDAGTPPTVDRHRVRRHLAPHRVGR